MISKRLSTLIIVHVLGVYIFGFVHVYPPVMGGSSIRVLILLICWTVSPTPLRRFPVSRFQLLLEISSTLICRLLWVPKHC